MHSFHLIITCFNVLKAVNTQLILVYTLYMYLPNDNNYMVGKCFLLIGLGHYYTVLCICTILSHRLLDLIELTSSGRVTDMNDAMLILSAVECLRSVMNNRDGLEYFISDTEAANQLIRGEMSCILYPSLYIYTFELNLTNGNPEEGLS